MPVFPEKQAQPVCFSRKTYGRRPLVSVGVGPNSETRRRRFFWLTRGVAGGKASVLCYAVRSWGGLWYVGDFEAVRLVLLF